MNEIRISGFGGQGVIRCGYIIGKIASLYDGKHATLTQSFGPEARGSACSAQILVDEKPIRYPYVTKPDTVVTMSQEAYDKFGSDLREGGLLLIDEDLVKPGASAVERRMYAVPATRIAEDIGNRIVANIVMLGFFTAVADIISVGAARKALPSSVPERFVDLNLDAFERGYVCGLKVLGKLPEGGAAAPKPRRAAPKDKAAPKKSVAKKAAPRKKAAAKKAAPRKAAAKKSAPKKKAAAKKGTPKKKAAAKKAAPKKKATTRKKGSTKK